MDKQKKTSEQPESRETYRKPEVKRWGTLRELTMGGGGTKKEPVTGNKTRF